MSREQSRTDGGVLPPRAGGSTPASGPPPTGRPEPALAPVTPTDQQRAAIETAGSLIVRAGAGSGKTDVLARRYVRLVCDGNGAGDDSPAGGDEVSGGGPLPVDAVLAVTFTDKAAAQMRTRIRQLVAERLAAAEPGACRERMLRVQRGLSGARISTIHALAAGLLKAHPLESGVEPGAAVLDEIEAVTWVEHETRRTLLAALRAGDDDVRRGAAEWGFARAAHGTGLVGIVCEALAAVARQGMVPADLEAALARQEVAAREAADDLRRDVARLVALVDAWVAVPRSVTRGTAVKDGAKVDSFVERWPAWRAQLVAFDAEAPVAALLALRDPVGAVPRAWRKGEAWAMFTELLQFKLESGTPRFRGAIPAAYGLCRSLPLARALARVVMRTARALDAAKRRDSVLTFDDLIAGARALLARHPTLATRAGTGVRVILVDEFQDTDPAQVDLLQRLAAGAELFAVGDEKQSIYRFRGAEVRLFAELHQRLGREVALADNFRAVPALVAFVNGLAARILEPPQAGAGAWWVRWTPDQRLRARRPVVHTATPAVRLKSLANAVGEGGAELRAAAVRALEARVVAATIQDLRREGRRYGEIAVLLPALTQVKAYEYALRRFAVPYEVVKGRGFFQCQEIRDLVSLLAAVVDPEDGVALAGVLRSPLFGVSDETLFQLVHGPAGARLTRRFIAAEGFGELPPAIAAQLRAARDLLITLRAGRDRRPIAELLAHALAATGYESVLVGQLQGEQKIANVRKLIEQARTFQRRRCCTLREFVAQMRRLLDGEPRESEAPLHGASQKAVQVMTIHQAKGLEFPVVILADLGREMRRDHRSPVVVDARYGTLVVPAFGSGRYRLPHRLVEAWRQQNLDRDAAERARLLYVACTRARDLLVLCEGKGKRGFLFAGADPASGGTTPQRRPSNRGASGVAASVGASNWCHQLWCFLGREAMAAFVAGDAERITLEVPGEGADGEVVAVAVEVEKSAALLGRVHPPEHDPVAEGIAAALATVPGPSERAHAARVFGFRPPPATELVVSPTTLVDFVRCPCQFFNRHVLALPETRGLGIGRAGDPVRLGTAAHAALETIDLACSPAERAGAVTTALAGARGLSDGERVEIGCDLIAALARWANADRDLVVLGRELPFCLPLAGAPRLFIRGRIDLVAARGTRLVVRDYKYARPAPDDDAYRVQVEIYALAVAAAHPGRAVDAEIEYLRGAGERVGAALDLPAARERLCRVGTDLAAALAAGDASAFPKAYAVPTPCRALGCAFISRCFAALR